MNLTKRGERLHSDPILVSHADLQKTNGESEYRVRCPVCEPGLLMVRRHPETLHLVNRDRCLFCGQAVIYTDKIIAGEEVTRET